MTKFIEDSYNGIYKVVLRPFMPAGKTVALLVVGVIIGLIWAYAISPVIFYDSDPSTLEQSWQDEWVKLLADRNANANADVTANIVQLLATIDDPLGTVDRLIVTPGEEQNVERLNAIRPLAEQAQINAANAPQTNFLSSILPFIIAPLVVTIVAVIVSLLWGLLIKDNIYEPTRKRLSGNSVQESPEMAAIRQQMAASKETEAKAKVDYAASNLGKPLLQRMSTFVLGYGQYDDTFSIENEQLAFLGECGASISKTIGVGEPQKPTAVEAWLFDKDDFVKTATTVFASEHAYNDPALRADLETKGAVVLARVGATSMVETANLRVQARVVDLEYGTGPMPPNSFFQKLSIELAAWRKDGTPVPAGEMAGIAAAPPAPYQPPPQPVYQPPAQPAYQPPPQPVYQPPPAQPAYQPPPQPTYQPPPPPYQPPSAPPSPLADDDPFGGTADFKPLR
jgi:hypothetical protein